jgi:hypothetical protein
VPLRYNKYTLDRTYLCLQVGSPGVVLGINAIGLLLVRDRTSAWKACASIVFFNLIYSTTSFQVHKLGDAAEGPVIVSCKAVVSSGGCVCASCFSVVRLTLLSMSTPNSSERSDD